MKNPDVIPVELPADVWRQIRQRAGRLRLPAKNPDVVNLLLNDALLSARKRFPPNQFCKMKYLLLDEHQQPKSCTPEEWAAWMKTDPDMGVEFSTVNGCAVGTTFISILTHDNAPCWETTVVGGKFHGKREVCSGARDQAEAMHAEMVNRIKQSGPEK